MSLSTNIPIHQTSKALQIIIQSSINLHLKTSEIKNTNKNKKIMCNQNKIQIKINMDKLAHSALISNYEY